MNIRTWQKIAENPEYNKFFGPGTKVIVVFKTARDHISGVIDKVDEELLVLRDDERGQIAAIIDMTEVLGFRTR